DDRARRHSAQPRPLNRVLVAARQRPRLVLRGEQLPQGKVARSLRPALLERGFDQSSRADVLLVPAEYLPREQAASARRGLLASGARRLRKDRSSGVCPGDARRPHRSVAHWLPDDAADQGREAVRARREWPRRWSDQSALEEQAQLLDQR